MVNGRTEAEDRVFMGRIRAGGDDAVAAMNEYMEIRGRILDGITDAFGMPRWIPVSERLPELYRSVIGWQAKWCGPAEVWLNDYSGWRLRGNMPANGITHWMPLPAPPEKEKP